MTKLAVHVDRGGHQQRREAAIVLDEGYVGPHAVCSLRKQIGDQDAMCHLHAAVAREDHVRQRDLPAMEVHPSNELGRHVVRDRAARHAQGGSWEPVDARLPGGVARDRRVDQVQLRMAADAVACRFRAILCEAHLTCARKRVQ